MKQLINILVLFAVFCLFGAPSCSEEGSRSSRIDRYLKGVRDTVISQFQKAPESEIDLAGYSRNAIQKLFDFADYLNVAADTAVEDDFRLQAANMARRLFIEGDTEIEIAGIAENGTKFFSADSLLRFTCFNRSSLLRISVSDVVFTKKFEEVAQGVFLSVLSFREDAWLENQQKKSCLAEADVILKKESKNFGKDSYMVWTVKLGDIRCTQE